MSSKLPPMPFEDKVIYERRGRHYFFEAWGVLYHFYQFGKQKPHVPLVFEHDGSDGLILPAGTGFPPENDEDEDEKPSRTQLSYRKKRDPMAAGPEKDEKRKSCGQTEGSEEKSDEAKSDRIEAEINSAISGPPEHVLDALFQRDFAVDNQRAEMKRLRRIGESLAFGPKSFYDLLDEDGFPRLESELNAAHPTMTQVIEFLLDELALGTTEPNPSPRPILLVGPPGCGKTYFANALAEQLHAPFFSMSMATADTAWQLTGINSNWAQAKPSGLIQKICESNARAGVMFFDEVTACQNDSRRNYPVLPTLLELLDLEQSRKFTDLFFDYQMDVSGWVKILACNSLEGLEAPIIDRCHVIHLSRPTAEQQLKIIERIAAPLPVKFSATALDALNKSSRSLRQIGADVRRLAAQALRKNQSEIHEIDVKRLVVSNLNLLQKMQIDEDEKIVH